MPFIYVSRESNFMTGLNKANTTVICQDVSESDA